MIRQETIQRIMDAARIEEVVGEFVQLKKRGANHIGCCPFHNEKTPSFTVSPSKGFYKCFGCGESGNVVGFLMKHEHFSYPEALTWLAKKYNIEIEEEKLSQEQVERNNERDALFHVSDFAQKYFASLLFDDPIGSAIGLSYFHNRGLSDNVIKEFGLGYCMDKWSDFTDHARKNGYSDNVLNKTGLTIFKDEGKSYDRFRGRVMFPIYSISGRVLGFSGRILSKEKQAAKYVNSPDSEIYNKGHILYGLYQAKNAISRQDKCYLVEGNIDVISMYQSGVQNCVASCGTALTVDQIRLIRRYTKNVTVLYDGDSAGIKAALRAVNLLFEEGMHVRVVLFPDGDDPDSYAQKYGSTRLQQYLAENETNFILFKTGLLMDEVKNDPIRKSEVLREIVRTIALVPDLMERTEYVSLCASRLHVPESTLQTELALELNRRLRAETGERKTAANSAGTPENGERVNDAGEQSPEDALSQFANEDIKSERRSPVSAAAAALVNPADYQERKIISLLLNNGNAVLPCEDTDEKGNTEMVNYTLAQIVVGECLQDDVRFETPVYKAIFDEFVRRIDGGDTIIDVQEIVSQADPEVRDTAISLMMEDYQISENWKKKNILVPTPQQQLRSDLDESLLSLKLKKLDRKIETLDNQFSYADTEEDRMLLLKQKIGYVKIRQQIGKALNRVII